MTNGFVFILENLAKNCPDITLQAAAETIEILVPVTDNGTKNAQATRDKEPKI